MDKEKVTQFKSVKAAQEFFIESMPPEGDVVWERDRPACVYAGKVAIFSIKKMDKAKVADVLPLLPNVFGKMYTKDNHVVYFYVRFVKDEIVDMNHPSEHKEWPRSVTREYMNMSNDMVRRVYRVAVSDNEVRRLGHFLYAVPTGVYVWETEYRLDMKQAA